MEKLSELSKPVFEIEISDGYWLNCSISPLQPRDGAKFNGWPDGVNRLYSQEYVSALKHESAVNWEAAASLNVENQELKKRIAELERANQSQDDHINQQQDRIDSLEKKNGDLGRSLGAAEKRLATPKPPEKCPTCNRRYTLESYAHGECAICGDPFDADDALRAMGFTVEGDE
ncbi:hypothetical protein I5N20_10390 [Serratia marcescens]|nr:hypothetical protein [Serratia marcescens]